MKPPQENEYDGCEIPRKKWGRLKNCRSDCHGCIDLSREWLHIAQEASERTAIDQTGEVEIERFA